LHLPESVPALISFTISLIQSMTANNHLPSPEAPLATLQAALTELENAEAAAIDGQGGTPSA
jgi:hypothetical protein